MKKSAITKLLHGECGVEFFHKDTRTNDVVTELCDNDDFMLKYFENNKEMLEAYRKVTNSIDAMWNIECETHFKEGFSLGVLLGLEIAGYDK